MKEQIPSKEILNKLRENNLSLRMSRVPKHTREKFIQLANEEFEGDYGMLLKWLMDGLVSAETAEILDQISELRVRLERLESGSTKNTSRKIRMLSGSVKEVKRND